ncbi:MULTISPECIES: hypothetical protein [Aeromonas]|uniref:hypothetical protein n=1 Tax=Aeromonas sobria TaxID=646 RepID=UPI0011E02335|nr:hypothetical protein [Aeromonas sobria]
MTQTRQEMCRVSLSTDGDNSVHSVYTTTLHNKKEVAVNVALLNSELDGILDEMEVLPLIQAMDSPAARRYHERRLNELRRSVDDLNDVMNVHRQEAGEAQLEAIYVKLAMVLGPYQGKVTNPTAH